MSAAGRGAGQRVAPPCLVGFVLLSLLAIGCSKPRFEGPQVQEPPYGFRFDANAYQARNVFPEREQLGQVAWFTTRGDDEHSSIFITTYAGPSDRAQVQGARDAQEQRYGGNMRYGVLEPIEIDERPAWGWLETQYYRGELASLEYKAVLSYDTVTYAIEFFSNQSEWMDGNRLREVVATFAVGTTKVNYLAIVVGAVIAVIGVWVYRRLGAQRAA